MHRSTRRGLTKEFILQDVFSIVPRSSLKVRRLLQIACQKASLRQLAVPAATGCGIWHRPQAPRAAFVGGPWIKAYRGERLWEFLIERWPIVVRQTTAEHRRSRGTPTCNPPARPLAVSYEDVRVFFDNFFEDGILTPISGGLGLTQSPKTWIE